MNVLRNLPINEKGSLITDTEMARVIRSSAYSDDGSKATVAPLKVEQCRY